MKIVDNRKAKIKFKFMEVGDTFLNEGILCMKISNITGKEHMNAYDFIHNTALCIEDIEEKYQPVNTEIHITE